MSEPRVTKPHHGGAHHGDNGTITRIVIHDEEHGLSNTSAESIADYFAEPNHGDSCAHYVMDSNSEQHCGRDDELMYHAPPNAGSIGIERDGYASWDAREWAQPAARRTTCNVAARTAELCLRHNVPAVWLSAADVKAGKHGITSHANVTAAFHQSTHTDPGPHFPVDEFMALVQQAHDHWQSGSRASVLDMGAWLDQSGDDDVALSDADKKWIQDTVDAAAAKAAKLVWTADTMPTPAQMKSARTNPTSQPQNVLGGLMNTALQIARKAGIDV